MEKSEVCFQVDCDRLFSSVRVFRISVFNIYLFCSCELREFLICVIAAIITKNLSLDIHFIVRCP